MAWTKNMAKNPIEASMFRELTDGEEKEFRQWARENPEEEIKEIHHPVVKDELRKLQNK